VSAVLAPSGQAALVARGFLPTGVAQSDAR